MGDYITTAELEARFEDDAMVAHLTDTPGESADSVVLTEVVESAEGTMNAYLGTRYVVPVDVSSDADLENALKAVALDIAQYRLLTRGDHVSDAKRQLYKDGLQWLRDVAKGVIELPAATSPASSSSSLTWGRGTAKGGDADNRVMTRSTQTGL